MTSNHELFGAQPYKIFQMTHVYDSAYPRDQRDEIEKVYKSKCVIDEIHARGGIVTASITVETLDCPQCFYNPLPYSYPMPGTVEVRTTMRFYELKALPLHLIPPLLYVDGHQMHVDEYNWKRLRRTALQEIRYRIGHSLRMAWDYINGTQPSPGTRKASEPNE